MAKVKPSDIPSRGSFECIKDFRGHVKGRTYKIHRDEGGPGRGVLIEWIRRGYAAIVAAPKPRRRRRVESDDTATPDAT